uniref:DNA-directed DNA polymerase n=1 Tax=Globodera rostochiensis TaxID=31243 RepID=A0A914H6I4_GLORO
MVSIWTTAQARLKLYSYLELIDKSENCKLIYTDTDSVIFMHPKGKCPIKEGNFLGEMSKEYAKDKILEVVCAGPKQYALKLQKSDGKICKFGPTRESYVTSRPVNKDYKPVQKKGIILDDVNRTVLPYGYY